MGLFMQLNAMLGRNTWPPASERELWDEIELWAAFRTSNDERIRQEASVNWGTDYFPYPLPRLISRASANLLFGEPADIKPAEEADTDNLERIVEENGLDSELHRGAMICSSEGSVVGKVAADPMVLDVPVIEFVSRSRTILHFTGRFCTGATFITEWREGRVERFRLFETYEPGLITSVLYRGSTNTLGSQVNLASYPQTKGKIESLHTGIDHPLVAFIPNSLDVDPTVGYSDYAGLRRHFLALNQANTIGMSNAELSGQKMALVDAGYLDQNQRLPKGHNIFIRTARHSGDQANQPKPLEMIDFPFESGQVIQWIDYLFDSGLLAAGIAPQSVGRSVDGGAVSGTALKLKMSHSLMEAAGKGRHFDRGLRSLLQGAQLVDQSIFGRDYQAAEAKPTVTRGDGLPADDIEAANRVATLYSSDAVSLEERVRIAHPEWNDQQVTDEVDRINGEAPPDVPNPFTEV